MTKVFLGGTWNGSKWREDLIPMLDIEYYNPVVADWTPDCMAQEIWQRKTCDFCLYVITPKMSGVYSIAEVVDDSNKRPEKTVFCVLKKDGPKEFTAGQVRSLDHVARMVLRNGGTYAVGLKQVAESLTIRNQIIQRNKQLY